MQTPASPRQIDRAMRAPEFTSSLKFLKLPMQVTGVPAFVGTKWTWSLRVWTNLTSMGSKRRREANPRHPSEPSNGFMPSRGASPRSDAFSTVKV